MCGNANLCLKHLQYEKIIMEFCEKPAKLVYSLTKSLTTQEKWREFLKEKRKEVRFLSLSDDNNVCM